MARTFEGGCLCGAVRLRLEDEPILTHACHCRFCQRVTGAPFAVNAMIELDRITLTGQDPEAVHTPSALPAGQKLHRCWTCRAMLWSNHSLLGDRIAIVPVGILDEAEAMVPDIHCFTATRHPWVVLPDDRPCFAGEYDSELVWSDRVKARIGAALAG
ncbi:GFA family protein [Geminicoccus flavidas]|uniref:GFA family protein n=1 Tax=Geminicoccus flavidas TaxID=2506407 RepID=UPI00135944DD|nr:GFA family protein [Geminicoccus flavidas]